MESSNRVKRRLRARRYKQGLDDCARVLDGIGVPRAQRNFPAVKELAQIWPRYLSRFRDGSDPHLRWSIDQRAKVQQHMDAVRQTITDIKVVWISLVDTQPVGVEVLADTLLDAALSYPVSPAADLMLVTRNGSDGICVELNRMPARYEYEIIAWGAFEL